MPTWSIIHSRHWKMQIPYLARSSRVITFDGRGNGRSDRPTDPEAYREEEFAADALAVMDATETERAVVVSLSRGAERSLLLAADHPERVEKVAFIAPALPLPPATPRALAAQEFREPHDTYDGWGKFNRHYWVEHYEDFLEFFFSQCLTEPHSTKPHEDTVGWGLETDAATLVATQLAPRLQDEADVRALLSRIDCPILVIHGQRRPRAPVGIGCATRGAGERDAGRPRRVGSLPPRPRPGQGQPAAPRLHRGGPDGRMTSPMDPSGRWIRPDAGRARLPDRSGVVAARGRRPNRIRRLREWRDDDPPASVGAHHPRAPMERADPVSESPSPSRRVRRPRQWSVRPAGGPRRLRRRMVHQ